MSLTIITDENFYVLQMGYLTKLQRQKMDISIFSLLNLETFLLNFNI